MDAAASRASAARYLSPEFLSRTGGAPPGATLPSDTLPSDTAPADTASPDIAPSDSNRAAPANPAGDTERGTARIAPDWRARRDGTGGGLDADHRADGTPEENAADRPDIDAIVDDGGPGHNLAPPRPGTDEEPGLGVTTQDLGRDFVPGVIPDRLVDPDTGPRYPSSRSLPPLHQQGQPPAPASAPTQAQASTKVSEPAQTSQASAPTENRASTRASSPPQTAAQAQAPAPLVATVSGAPTGSVSEPPLSAALPVPAPPPPMDTDTYLAPSPGIEQRPEPVSAPPVSTSASAAPALDRPDSGGLFYGWILVGAVFFIMAISSGIGFYNASVILSAAAEELDASVGSVSGATGLFFAISGLTGFLFAKRMDAVDIRWFFFCGGLVGAVALLGLRWVDSVAWLYVFFGLFGVGFSLAGLVPGTTLVTRWFDHRRSVALSVASTGLSVGGIVVTPVSAWLIEQRTLAGASPYLAAIWVIGIIPIALLLVRSHPSDKGLLPDGGPLPVDDRSARSIEPVGDGSGRPMEPAVAQQTAGVAQQTAGVAKQPAGVANKTAGVANKRAGGANKSARNVPGLSFAAARSTRFFIALCVAYAVIFFGQVGAIAQLFNMVLERSDSATAKTSLSTLAFTSVVFRLVGGAVAMRLPTKSFTAALAVVQALALVLLAGADSRWSLILTSAFLGVSIGNLLMLQPLLLAEVFGVAHYGRIYSFNQLFGTIGVAGGPFALGVLRDAYDYRTAFLVAAAASFVGFIFIVLAGSSTDIQSRWQVAPAVP